MKFLTNEKSQIISASGQMKCQESAPSSHDQSCRICHFGKHGKQISVESLRYQSHNRNTAIRDITRYSTILHDITKRKAAAIAVSS